MSSISRFSKDRINVCLQGSPGATHFPIPGVKEDPAEVRHMIQYEVLFEAWFSYFSEQ